MSIFSTDELFEMIRGLDEVEPQPTPYQTLSVQFRDFDPRTTLISLNGRLDRPRTPVRTAQRRVCPKFFRARDAQAERFQQLVDEWIASGVKSNGETPKSRTLSATTRFEVCKCMRACTLGLQIPEDDRGLEHAICWIDVTAEPRSNRRFFFDESAYAVWDFTRLLITGNGSRICKCRYHLCGKYFLLKRVKTVYSRGTFCCATHSRAHSAAELTKARRNFANARLIQTAASKMLEWDQKNAAWQRRNPKNKWAVDQLNAYIAKDRLQTRSQISKNWLTWNRLAIETAMHTQVKPMEEQKA